MNPIVITNKELEIGRRAIEDFVIEMRDTRVSLMDRGNGICCREKNGDASSIIRCGTAEAVKIAIKAINESRLKPA